MNPFRLTVKVYTYEKIKFHVRFSNRFQNWHRPQACGSYRHPQILSRRIAKSPRYRQATDVACATGDTQATKRKELAQQPTRVFRTISGVPEQDIHWFDLPHEKIWNRSSQFREFGRRQMSPEPLQLLAQATQATSRNRPRKSC